EEQEECSHEGGTREQRESHAQEVVPEGITDRVLALGVVEVGQENVVEERHVSSVLYGRSSAMSGWSRQNSITLAMSTKLNPDRKNRKNAATRAAPVSNVRAMHRK